MVGKKFLYKNYKYIYNILVWLVAFLNSKNRVRLFQSKVKRQVLGTDDLHQAFLRKYTHDQPVIFMLCLEVLLFF